VVSDLDAGTVDYLADERRTSSLDSYFDRFTVEQRAGIHAVAMDMWDPYISSTKAHLADADDKIVFDRYHLMKYLTTAVDTVRKQENRGLDCRRGQAPRRLEVPVAVLGGEPARPDTTTGSTACALVTSRPPAPGRSRKACGTSGPTTARGWAAKHFKRWYFWATHCRLQPVIDVAKMLKRRLNGHAQLLRPPLTNAASEGLAPRVCVPEQLELLPGLRMVGMGDSEFVPGDPHQ